MQLDHPNDFFGEEEFITMELTLKQAKALADIAAQVISPDNEIYLFYYDLTRKLEMIGEDKPAYDLVLDKEQGTIGLEPV
jgi:hypothetical protein